ncbi:MAG: hotdog fold thioesterase [Deltaproteobacteria bacterium]|nr:hotdog fold thioesterase [Deltaproteobacteria bacterium]
MDKIKEFFKKDQFAEYVGIELLEAGLGTAVARLEIKDRHLNGVGIVHGGAVFSLADLAFAVASNSHGTVALAINADISFLKAVSAGVLTARAWEVSRNSKLATYRIDVTEDGGDLVAVFQGTVYRKKEALPGLTDS